MVRKENKVAMDEQEISMNSKDDVCQKARYVVELDRLIEELEWCVSYNNAMHGILEIRKEHFSQMSFFTYASWSCFEAMIGRAMKVLDKTRESRSFFYIYNEDPVEVNKYLRKAGLKISSVKKLAKNLTFVRNKTFVHIDKEHVSDQNHPWRLANIVAEEFDDTIKRLYAALKQLRFDKYGIYLSYEPYTAADMTYFVRTQELKNKQF
jgi:hypothetical protein